MQNEQAVAVPEMELKSAAMHYHLFVSGEHTYSPTPKVVSLGGILVVLHNNISVIITLMMFIANITMGISN